MNPKVLILNGPNLNMLGRRQPEIYGSETLADIEKACMARAKRLGMRIDFRQTNAEADLVDWIQGAVDDTAGIVINAAGFTHTSVAVLDALLASGLPVIEVHLSNIFGREKFRRHSYISQAARGIICGLGGQGYLLALDALNDILTAEAKS